MRKRNFFMAVVFSVVATAVVFSSPRAERVSASEGNRYYIGGMAAGFNLSAGGTEIIGLSEVATENGICRPAEDAGIRVGDTILAVDGIKINNISDLNAALARSEGKEITLTIKRNGDKAEVKITPVLDKKGGRYKIGILIRDTLSGIGTVTYIDKETLRFGALGHAVCDENKTPLAISDEKVSLCSIVGINKGSRGKAGELKGIFIGEEIGKAHKACETGLYGTFRKDYDFSRLQTTDIAPISEATIGKAVIYSTVDGVFPQKYDICIAKIEANSGENKNFVIKVTDDKLIAETGGIVQGMSGSPIIQNGKLIGAVTHVFLNDPTRGYGIAIENMIEKEQNS